VIEQVIIPVVWKFIISLQERDSFFIWSAMTVLLVKKKWILSESKKNNKYIYIYWWRVITHQKGVNVIADLGVNEFLYENHR
jgi:hypothetical protein